MSEKNATRLLLKMMWLFVLEIALKIEMHSPPQQQKGREATPQMMAVAVLVLAMKKSSTSRKQVTYSRRNGSGCPSINLLLAMPTHANAW